MKKHLLLIISALFVISVFAADLNPYAYDLKVLSTDAENFKVTLQYSLNAPASSVKIYAKDGAGTSYLLKEFGTRSARTYTVEIDLMDAMLNKGVPAGEELSWYVDVACASRGTQTKAVTCGRKIDFRSPFSIDIDNNPHSPYFGRILTTQANNNEDRGVKAFNPDFTQIGHYVGAKNIMNFQTGNWFDNTHVTPFRIRVLQDGTGKVFVSSADVGQPTYMWQVDPANLNNWSVFLTSAEMIKLTKHPDDDDSMANHNFDFRKKANGEWELLLLSSSINAGNIETRSGYSHSGIYTLNADLSKKEYNEYVTNKAGSPHSVVDDKFVASVLSGNAQFDPNGNILYSSYQLSSSPEGSALIHHQVQSGVFAKGYNSFERLRRDHTASGGMRYNSNSYSDQFKWLAVAAGNQTKEVSICNVSHTQGYMTIAGLYSVDMISDYHSTAAYIVDFAWDYASNLYACVRNSSESDLRGVWVMALNLEGKAVSTPARDKFSIPCQSGKTYTISCSAQDGLGSVTGAGTYESCTKRTVTATPKDNNYRFSHWTDQSGKTVSTNAEYTFYLVKDVTLTAHFIPSVFEVTWWNLFQNGEDIAKESTAYPNTNERLWRLYQVEFEAWRKSKEYSAPIYHYEKHTPNTRLQFNVASFFVNRTEENETFLETSPSFYWLERYLTEVNGLEIVDKVYDASLTFHRYNRLQYMLYLFFNRTDTAYNATPSNANPNVNGVDYTKKEWWKYENGKYDKSKKFKDYAKTNYWRPWWTEGVCGLPKTYNYADSMPVTWTQNACASGDATDHKRFNDSPTKNKETEPSKWYKWNTAPKANQLLAWREGGTDPKNNRIVHHVDKSMALYATYVDKNLQENDPEPSGQYDAKNSDVLSLLANDKHGETLHNVTIDRKFAGGMYNTVCFPFDLPVSKLPSELSGADIRVFSGVSETYNESGDPVVVLNFETLTDYWTNRQSYLGEPYMEAGVPYLISPTYDVNEASLTYSGLKQNRFLEDIDSVRRATYYNVKFQGVLNPTTITEENAYILVADSRLAKVTGNNKEIKGFRGYFIFDDAYIQSLAAEGRVYLSMRKPATTSIPLAPEAEQPVQPKVRKVMHDGKIYILRGDEVYDIMGHRLK